MAELKGPIQFTGTLGNLVAYELNGKIIVRTKSSLTKDRIKKDPAFVRTRESNQEFGGASTISKFLRTKWIADIRKDKDPKVHHRLNSKIFNYILSGQGIRGQRFFSWTDIKTDFDLFNINNSPAPHKFTDSTPIINRNGNNITLNTQSIHINNAPSGTTHYRVFSTAAALFDFNYNENVRKYSPSNDTHDYNRSESSITPLNESIQEDLELLNLNNDIYAITFGIEFYQEIGGEYYKLNDHPFAWIAIA